MIQIKKQTKKTQIFYEDITQKNRHVSSQIIPCNFITANNLCTHIKLKTVSQQVRFLPVGKS